VALLYGLACSIHFLLPPAYWYAAHYQGRPDHFEAAVLAAVNSGGNNMARAALTGGWVGGAGGLKGRNRG
jgi:ADP-ribosylglycohydrolase